MGFRLFPFRSPLLRESHMISFPPITEMFQFTGYPASSYDGLILISQDGVTPFGNHRVKRLLKSLPAISRLYTRPSSAQTAKASSNGIISPITYIYELYPPNFLEIIYSCCWSERDNYLAFFLCVFFPILILKILLFWEHLLLIDAPHSR